MKTENEHDNECQVDAVVGRNNGIFSPVIVCTVEQIEKLCKDQNFQKQAGVVYPIFQPNKIQLQKLKKILEHADKYFLTNDGLIKIE